MKIFGYTALLLVLAVGAAEAQKRSCCDNLLENGSFEAPTSPPVRSGGFGHFTAVPGWTVTGGDTSRLEIQNNIYGPVPDGSHYLEVASSARTWVSQTVETERCTCYALSFAYRQRPGWASELDVYWNDTRVESLPGQSAAPGWGRYQVVVRGTGDDVVTFRDVSRPDAGGGLIDDVSLCPIPCVARGCVGQDVVPNPGKRPW